MSKKNKGISKDKLINDEEKVEKVNNDVKLILCKNVDQGQVCDKNSDSNNSEVFQDSFEEDIGFENFTDKLEDNENYVYYYDSFNKVESNLISSLEFIWSEIRSDNIFEGSDFSETFESNCIYLKNRIPKNALNEVFQVPKRLEYILNFSMLLCFDTILYDLTFLPINSTIAIFKLILLSLIMIKDYLILIINEKSNKNDVTKNNNDSSLNNDLEFKKIRTWEFILDKKRLTGPFLDSNENIKIESFYKDLDLKKMKSDVNNFNIIDDKNNSIEYLFEEKQTKSRSMFDINELQNKLKHKIHEKSKDDGFLSKNNNFLPQLKNHVHSYRMNDQKSSFEELELKSNLNYETSQDGFNNNVHNFKEFNGKLEDKNYDFKLSAIEITDLSRFLVLLFSILIFSKLDISFFYHYIRGQGLLKLYVIFNMLEVFEKLFRSFGRDLIDNYLESVLYYFLYLGFVRGKLEIDANKNIDNTANQDIEITFRSTLLKYSTVIIYLLTHCIIHMVRGLALNISLNSSEYTMFLIVVTNNFAEIKSSVFKTYHSISLFTVACSDAIERFQLLYDGFILFIRIYSNTRLYSNSIYISVITWIISIYIVEVIVDWFKHSFLVKFNKIKSNCYNSYVYTLIGDVLLSRGSNLALEYLLKEKNDSNNNASNMDKNFNDKTVTKSSLVTNKYNNHFANSSSINSITRQSTYSLMRGNTMGLEVDVSLLQNREEFKPKRRRDENLNSGSKEKDMIFISKELRGIYAFPYIISRRVGFVSLPLTILLMCVLLFSKLHSTIHVNHLLIIWFFLFLLKYLSSITIISFSQSNIDKLKDWNSDFNKINAL